MGDRDIRALRNSVIDIMNKSSLPLEVKRLILVELTQMVTTKVEDIMSTEVRLENGSTKDLQSN